MYSLIEARTIKPILFNYTSNKRKNSPNYKTTLLCNFSVFLLGTITRPQLNIVNP